MKINYSEILKKNMINVFKDVLKDAQVSGYAESNPRADLNGNDVSDKIKILSSSPLREPDVFFLQPSNAKKRLSHPVFSHFPVA